MQRLARAFSTRSATSLLADSNIAGVLSTHQLTPTTPLPDSPALLAVLAAFRQVCEKPLPSDVFLRVRTAADIAEYYEGALAPQGVSRHAANLHAKVTPEPLPRVDATPAAVGAHVGTALPPNLTLDPKTFSQRPVAVMSTGARPKNVPVFNRRVLLEQRRQKRAAARERRRAERAAAMFQ